MSELREACVGHEIGLHDPVQRKAEYGDPHKQAYDRVRWLKSRAIERAKPP